MGHLRLWVAALLGGVAVASASAAEQPQQAQISSQAPTTATIAYGRGGIRLIRPDGTRLRRLTGSDGDYQPSWSPNGRLLAFRSDRAEPGPMEGVVLIDRRSGRERRLTRRYLAGFPAWSPDGQLISFSGTAGTYVIRPDGRDRRLVFANGEWSTWSPDARRLALISPRDGNDEIYSVDVATGEALNLTHDRARDVTPAWSPDGALIAFVSDRDGNDELYVMESDGSDVRRLTRTPRASESFPTWTADGVIVFARFPMSRRRTRVLVVSADGRAERRLSALERAGIRFPIALFRVRASSLR
jgi:Tol biopolymer transport system component